jgi:large exoprotein involved in heme utilization and adhesion
MNRTDCPTQNTRAHPIGVAAGIACHSDAGSRSSAGPGARLTSLTLRALSASLLLALAMPAHATVPTGGVVTAGQASITSNGSTTTITQSSANVIINWQSFSIGAGDTVQFMQPGRTSVALNRVLGADP